MSLALYRKYRPGSFAEVIGQEHVTEPLSQALAANRVHHAYLFSGPRGCGKTSCARILARSLNCVDGPTPHPCGVCDSCVALAPNGPGSLDVIEIDAASHGGVDDARDLRERAFFAPVASRYKVYIVDEAHMVSREGFNALLKLVEEPPEHVKFVFATTEPDKVIATIRSRTFHYPFRLVPPGVLREYLAGVCAREGAEVEPLVLPLVVRAAAGSVRDALSLLDQLIAGAGAEGVSFDRALQLLGFTDAALLDEVVEAVGAGDGGGVLRAIDRVVEAGHDPRRFAADLLGRFRDLIVLQAVPDAAESGLLDLPADQLERMRGQVAAFGPAELSRAADILNTGLTEMRGTTSPRLQLELMCARLLLPGADDGGTGLASRVERLERRAQIAGAAAPRREEAPATAPTKPPEVAVQRGGGPRDAAPRDAAPESAPAAAEPAAPAQPAAPEPAPAGLAEGVVDATAVRRVWPDVLDAVKLRKRVTHAYLLQAQVSAVEGDTLTLVFGSSVIAGNFEDSVGPDIVREALREVLGVDWKVRALTSGKDPGPAPAAAPDVVEDDDATSDSDPVVSMEDRAISLLQEGLGAKVIGEIEG